MICKFAWLYGKFVGLGKRCYFFIGWEFIAIRDACVIMGDDCCIIVHISMASNVFWWILVDFMTEFGFSGRISRMHFFSESIVCDSGDGGVFNATIIDHVFVIAGGDVWIGVGVTVIIFLFFLT